jgi:HD-like signal output (HDOD) protein
MYRILFVDDELPILKALKRMLRNERHEWESVFASTAAEALEMMRRERFDVIVADMHMVGTDGVVLLAQVQKEFPETGRVMISGYTDPGAVLRAAPVAHQFLTRPCSAETLKTVIKQVLTTQASVSKEAVRSIIGQVGKIPSVPKVYAELVEIMQDQNSSIDRVVRVVEKDAGLTIKVLHMVNTAFFGLPQSTTSLTHAISLLGMTVLRNVILASEIFEVFDIDERRFPDLRSEAIMNHSSAVSRLASRLSPTAAWRDDAFTGGLLHDFGKLLLAARLSDEYAKVLDDARSTGRSLHDLERDSLGFTHAEVAAYLMELWHLPHGVSQAVALHHSEVAVEPGVLTAPGAVYIANQLIHAREQSLEPLELNDLVSGLGFGASASEWIDRLDEVCPSGQRAPAL